MTFTFLMTRHRRMNSLKKEYEADFDQLREENAKRIKTLSSSEPPSYDSHKYASPAYDKTLFLVPTTSAVEVGPDSAASSPGVERIEFLPMMEERLAEPATTPTTESEQQQEQDQDQEPSQEQDQAENAPAEAERTDRGDVEYIDYDELLDEMYYGNPESHELPPVQRQQPREETEHQQEPNADYIEIEAFKVPDPTPEPHPLTELYTIPMCTPALSRRTLAKQGRKGKSQQCRLIVMTSQEILCWKEPI